MPTPKLSITIRNANSTLDKLQCYKNESENLEAKYQYFISEMIMLRLFALFEEGVAEIAYKLASGAEYLNGTLPTLTVRANSVSGARSNFLTHGFTKPKQNLKWTKAKYINESVQNIIPASEKYIINVRIHGASIDEMRKVRNVLAHNTSSAKTDFKQVIHTTYGANIPMNVGAFLASTRRQTPCTLTRYIASVKIILKEIASGQ
jgi:hypothetical protein